MAKSQNQTRTDDTRRYFSGNKEQPKQYQVYQCTCGAYQQRYSAQHWRSTNWQGSACNRCNKRVNLNWGKCQFFDTKEKAEQYIHHQYCGERLARLGDQIVKQNEGQYMGEGWKIDPNMLETYENELYWLNRDLYEDYLHLQAKFGTTVAEMALSAYIHFEHYTSPSYVAKMNSRKNQRWTRKQAKKAALGHTQGNHSHMLPGAKSANSVNAFMLRWLV